MSIQPPPFDAAAFRKSLHQQPELSGKEANTAKLIANQLTEFELQPITDVGGHGVICIIDSGFEGQTTLLRADFDAVAVLEKSNHQHVSKNIGVMHACGHDGHTTSLLKVAQQLRATPPKTGKVILLFQPAEETGVGAAAMISHAALKNQAIDNVFAYHNLPGRPKHQIVVKEQTFSCASTGISIKLEGKTSHAAYPENGISPINEFIEILAFLQNLPNQYSNVFTLVTIVNAQLGEEAFGVSAGAGKIMATLRSESNQAFDDMKQQLISKLSHIQQSSKLSISHSWHEPFNAAVNSKAHVDVVRNRAKKLNLDIHELDQPMRWSEDFAEFLLHAPGALFGIGSGEHHPELHNPDYDFPDEILNTASSLFLAIVDELHNPS
ncbi:amidohydrolase [Vibrio sp. LaRot3]|uniref:amidohydrolase n=1 Tax=Vibrio sp. LaRot3 TaxID=2998829 RepID=UPI0022CE21E3|nr:amidohydrolase [Vibrio sp. LaRot3]MDA0148264.1 amidohydrolase [Vibrio sp. LaRot3]